MTELDKSAHLTTFAEFVYEGQEDLAKIIGLVNPADIDLSLSYQSATSERFQELYSWMTSPDGNKERYQNTQIQGSLLKKTFPLKDTMNLLPIGIQNFLADLDELIELSEKERVNPLLRIIQKEDYRPEIDWSEVYIPQINALRTRFISPSGVNKNYSREIGQLNALFEVELYWPRIQQLRAIGGLARGLRPHIVSYINIKKESVARDCLEILTTVPDQNKITYLRIGAEPRDEGGREYYHWKSSAIIEMLPESKTFTFKSKKPTNFKAMETALKMQGINIHLKETD